MLSSTCYEEKTKPITINNFNKQSISISIPIAIPTTPDNNSNYIDEYSLNCNNFNPSKKCISMLDEQSLVYFYLTLNKEWKQLHHVYNSIPW